MKKPKLNWEKSGRSFVAYAERLRLTVAKRPERFVDGGKWRITEVFGDQFALMGVDFDSMEEAAIAAEACGRRALKFATKALGRG